MNEKMLSEIIKIYDEKLKELMPENEYTKFVESVAKTAFAAEIMLSPNEDFKKMVFENWDEITAPIKRED